MKRCNDKNQPFFDIHHPRPKRGASSYNMHDAELVFQRFNLVPGQILIDMGCGAGEYSLRSAAEVGEHGRVYAIDICQDLLDGLLEEARLIGLNNIRTCCGDICNRIELPDEFADLCILVTVLHGQKATPKGRRVFSEAHRLLKTSGRLAVIECKKQEMPFGPPLSMRIHPDELSAIVLTHGFEANDYVDLGYNYMVLFQKKGECSNGS